LSVNEGERAAYVLAHELGHNPIGLEDEYCEHKRFTSPEIYPNSFETFGDCQQYSVTHLGGRECRMICDWDEKYNEENGGWVLKNEGPVMMQSGGEFSLPEQMRVNWFFDCCTPDSCSDLPVYCSSNICGSCSVEDGELAPCAEVVCNQQPVVTQKPGVIEEFIDIDEDGVQRRLDCNDRDYAVHPGEPEVKFLESMKRLSESCDQLDYDCDSFLKQQCSFTPKCYNTLKYACTNEHEYNVLESEGIEGCCGGCVEFEEFKVVKEDSCDEGICSVSEDGRSLRCDYSRVSIDKEPVYRFKLEMLQRADYNHDGKIDLEDFFKYSGVFGTLDADINGDGVSDKGDTFLINEMIESKAAYDLTRTTLPVVPPKPAYAFDTVKKADYNGDLQVTLEDFYLFAEVYGTKDGDIDFDGVSNLTDYELLAKMIEDGVRYEN